MKRNEFTLVDADGVRHAVIGEFHGQWIRTACQLRLKGRHKSALIPWGDPLTCMSCVAADDRDETFIYVDAAAGHDENSGDHQAPLQSFSAAIKALPTSWKGSRTILLAPGTYPVE